MCWTSLRDWAQKRNDPASSPSQQPVLTASVDAEPWNSILAGLDKRNERRYHQSVSILVSILISAVAVFVAAQILPGVHVDGFGTSIVVAIVLGVVNGFIRPLLLLLTLPINVMTLGLFTLVVIGVCVLLVDAIVPGFSVDGFLWALIFAAVLAVISGFLNTLTAKSA